MLPKFVMLLLDCKDIAVIQDLILTHSCLWYAQHSVGYLYDMYQLPSHAAQGRTFCCRGCFVPVSALPILTTLKTPATS